MKDKITKTIKDNPRERLEIEIGDVKQADFFPQVKFKKWDNEVNFSIRYDNGSRDYVKKDNKVVCEGSEDVVLYELSDGFEFEVIIKEKPISNVFNYSIETKGLDFFYQPELTQKEKDNGASRPDNVVGSYAVYHKTKRNNNLKTKHNYKTGKAFHIYRPKAIDNNGNEVWCELNISGNRLSVTVPQSFLDKAVYPVIVDPTFGYESIGASLFSWGLNEKTPLTLAFRYTPNVDGTASTLHYYSYFLGTNFLAKMGLYNFSDGEGSFTDIETETKDETTLPMGVGNDDWTVFSVDSATTDFSGGDYLIAIQSTGVRVPSWNPRNIHVYYDSGDDELYYNVHSATTDLELVNFPTTLDTQDMSWSNLIVSMYVTYEESAPQGYTGPFPTFRRPT